MSDSETWSGSVRMGGEAEQKGEGGVDSPYQPI